MREVKFAIEGYGEFACDADQVTNYHTGKLLAYCKRDAAYSFEAMERIFMGRDDEYMERLGGDVAKTGVLLEAAIEAVGEEAKNSSASSPASNGTEAKQ